MGSSSILLFSFLRRKCFLVQFFTINISHIKYTYEKKIEVGAA